MLKFKKNHSNLKIAMILSIILHCALFLLLLSWNLFHPLSRDGIEEKYKKVEDNKSLVEVKMIDPTAIEEHYSIKNKKVFENKKLQHQQSDSLNESYSINLKKLELEKSGQKQEKMIKQKAIHANQTIETKKDTSINKIKVHSSEDESSVNMKRDVSTKTIKQSDDIDILLNNLIHSNSVSKTDHYLSEINKNKSNNNGKAEIDAYKEQISQAISDKFYDASMYKGKICDLNIVLSPEGLLTSINAIGGDPALCQAAISAAKLANIPRPPDSKIYEIFKNAALRFSP